MPKNLTPRQRLFVAKYGVSLNATEAAKQAGYSEKTARSQGSRLLTNVDVLKAIREGQEKTQERLQDVKEEQLRFLATIRDSAPLDKVTVQHGLAAARELNQMMGYYAAPRGEEALQCQKVEIHIGIRAPEYTLNERDAGTGALVRKAGETDEQYTARSAEDCPNKHETRAE